jgi:Tol biopolymer transport system component
MDHSIRLWDFASRQRRSTLQGHLSEVWALAFSPDGQTLVSGAKDGDIKLWPTQAQRKEDVLTGVRQPLGFSRNGRTLAGLTRDGSVVFLNLATSESEPPFQLERRRNRFTPFGPTIALSDDLGKMAQGLEDGTVKLWDTETRETTTLKVSDGAVDFVALSPDGQWLITRGRDWISRRWDLRNGSSAPLPAEVFKTVFSPDGRQFATFGRGNVVQLWDAATLVPRTALAFEEPPALGFTAVFSADSRVLAVVYQDDAIRLWDTTSGKLLGTCTGHKQGVRSVAFSPDGKTLATASDDSTLKLWNVATQQELITIRRLGATLSGLMFSPDGRLLVGGSGAFSQAGELRLYRAPLLAEIDTADASAKLKR